MIRRLRVLYRRWRILAHRGLTDHSIDGASKHLDAKAIGTLASIAPMLPLAIADGLEVERGWLWYTWAALAAVWFFAVWAEIFRVVGRAFTASWKHRRD